MGSSVRVELCRRAALLSRVRVRPRVGLLFLLLGVIRSGHQEEEEEEECCSNIIIRVLVVSTFHVVVS